MRDAVLPADAIEQDFRLVEAEAAGEDFAVIGQHLIGDAVGPKRCGETLSKKGMRILVAGKLAWRSWQDNDGDKRHAVEIQVAHIGPDAQFATAEVAKSTADGSGAPESVAG